MNDAFDSEEFSDRVMGNETLARRILRGFVDSIPAQLAQLAQAVGDGDAARVRLAAHSIKGAAASVSGSEMREAAWKLEKRARENDLSDAPVALAELSRSFERAKPAMEAFCEQIDT